MEPIREPVRPPTPELVGVEAIAGTLGLSPQQLRDMARRGELREDVHAGQLLVAGASPLLGPERLVAGTTRFRARMAQSVALEHFFERLLKPAVPNRSI
ncbi:MAG TPA: hypothetical protein VFS62_16055 [Chloroflexota bacterium]|jgi:hypothetical protein|nr:hypothetical protein [Chloroflexota bacterium]